ncbi:hypothetical protein PVAP13_3NG258083 [Panicum virgatum]|uniref:DUF1618 domain-containing protein n=1 Tax=Panicum virgatum TaxID=38727 RepID=A0A8T0U826_PANVG|nr:hypothetical protein PVAP13_3NG258083 [Panicum virgatum]
MARSTVSSWVPPSLPESAAVSGFVLLDKWCYIADLPNNTTTESTTSTGLSIKVTIRAARPTLPSHFSVHCPGLDFCSIGPISKLPNTVIVSTDADLVLLCVPVDPYNIRGFVLGLLRLQAARPVARSATEPVPVAALGVRPPVYRGDVLIRWEYDLHLYRSSDSKGWMSKRLSVNEFERDRLIPLPEAEEVDDRLYHETAETITIGGEHGTVAWVDLWRGIFFCDVLKKRPLLQDVPLPVPAMGNWDSILHNCDPSILRDVTISRNKKKIDQPIPIPDSYTDWVHNYSGNSQVIRDGWKSTTWNMAIPAVDVKDVNMEASDPRLSDLMAMLSSKTTRTWKELPVAYPHAYPILSMDDDVVYLLSLTRLWEVMFAVDVRKARLQGFAELDVQKSTTVSPSFCTSEMCRLGT